MKTFRIVFSAILLTTLVTYSFAAAPDSITDARNLRREVSRMIDAPDLDKMGLEETFVFVNFKVTENNEIIVLNVLGASDELCQTVKESLNHRKVSSVTADMEQEYNLRVNFVAEEARGKR